MCSSENSKFDKEFYRRIKHDFRKYLLLKSNGIHVNEEVILQTLYKMDGYKRHKKVNHGEYTSHIIVMFIDMFAALEAIARLNLMTFGLSALLVDDMLRSWFSYEQKTCRETPYSLTIVDITGNPPLNLNFLTSNILSTIFHDFGAPYLLPYTAALNENHMQVLFSSMTEALAACMAFGEWYCVNDKADCFFYRVRINPSHNEANLIKNCGGTPAEAFKLSYFITLKKEAKFERVSDSVTKEKRSKQSRPRNSETEEMHKQESQFAQSCTFRQINPLGYGTPVLYFPIIPTNRCNAHASSNNHLGAGHALPLLNLKQAFQAQPVITVTNLEIGNVVRQHKSLEEIPECTDDKKSHQSNAFQNNRESQRHMQHGLTRTRGNQRRTSRVFERRR